MAACNIQHPTPAQKFQSWTLHGNILLLCTDTDENHIVVSHNEFHINSSFVVSGCLDAASSSVQPVENSTNTTTLTTNIGEQIVI
jgi:hypothetical protein